MWNFILIPLLEDLKWNGQKKNNNKERKKGKGIMRVWVGPLLWIGPYVHFSGPMSLMNIINLDHDLTKEQAQWVRGRPDSTLINTWATKPTEQAHTLINTGGRRWWRWDDIVRRMSARFPVSAAVDRKQKLPKKQLAKARSKSKSGERELDAEAVLALRWVRPPVRLGLSVCDHGHGRRRIRRPPRPLPQESHPNRTVESYFGFSCWGCKMEFRVLGRLCFFVGYAIGVERFPLFGALDWRWGLL